MLAESSEIALALARNRQVAPLDFPDTFRLIFQTHTDLPPQAGLGSITPGPWFGARYSFLPLYFHPFALLSSSS